MKEQVLTKAGLTVYDEEIKQHIQEVVDSIEMPSTVTEATVSDWGFTKNTGTYSKPSTGIPKSDLASAVQTALEKAETALQSFTETDPTVPTWAKQPNKPTYTAKEVGALPSSTVVPTKTSELTNDSGFLDSNALSSYTPASAYQLVEYDTRSDNQPPSWYMGNFPLRMCIEFKSTSVIGVPLSSGSAYVMLHTCTPWNDATGGLPTQHVYDSGKIYTRYATDVSTWSGWNIYDPVITTQTFDTAIEWNDDETVYTETWTYNGDSYKNVCTIVDDTHSTRQLYKNNVLQGTWNSVETSNGITTSYVAP